MAVKGRMKPALTPAVSGGMEEEVALAETGR
jgi:hypothetical protein